MAISTQFINVIIESLPLLRRFARALTGNQRAGDRYVTDCLEAFAEDGGPVQDDAGVRITLFRSLARRWFDDGSPVDEAEDLPTGQAQNALAELDAHSRTALLLHVLAGFDFDALGVILEMPSAKAQALVYAARRRLAAARQARVLVIEDETFVAMDLAGVVSEMGHRITGTASTGTAAIELAARERPDLILADIALADNSSGIEAVRTILGLGGPVPVIFITAFPDRMPTDTRPESACVIGKPYTEDQLRSAVSEAIFFGGVSTLANDDGIGLSKPGPEAGQ